MPGFKHIVVHVDGSAHDASVLRLAAAISARFGAGLEAVFANVPPFVPATVDGMLAPQILEAQQTIARERARKAKSAFDALGLKSAVWRTVDAGAAEAVLARGRYADLVVLAQPAPEDSDAATDYDAPAEVVMALGRPVLMVPYAGTFADVGKRVLAAWNGSRESARALADAMPLLAAANEVNLLSINPTGEAEAMRSDLRQWLAAHAIKGKVSVARTEDMEVGDVLLSTAADMSADLIVMGAYGRSRLRELILGGATHDMFRHMTVPVLMSH